jgi:hypothetical protein
LSKKYENINIYHRLHKKLCAVIGGPQWVKYLMACSTAWPNLLVVEAAGLREGPLLGVVPLPKDPREGLMEVKNSMGLYWLPLNASR